MKTFINVLYRKILYRIPLKFLLLLLAIFGLLFASFSNAENVGSLITYVKDTTTTTISSNGGIYQLLHFNVGVNDTYCIENISSSNTVIIGFNSSLTFNNDYSIRFGRNVKYVCVSPYLSDSQVYLYLYNPFANSSTTITFKLFKLNALIGTNLPAMTSLECQTEYSLIPISSVDQNYCTTNNLCPSCPVCPPSGGSGRSNVYINDILHVGAPNIVMNIAEEIDWDYEYTAGGNNMNIDVVGYNVDYEKIGEIIDNQSYKPSSEDFKNILGILAPYTKIIVFFVFLFLVWAWIKKPFKSKKL